MDFSNLPKKQYTTTGNYVQATTIFKNKNTEWTFVDLELDLSDIVNKSLVIWCDENVESKWTMLGGSKFGFEDGSEALMFKLQFGL
ncbi:hypothetical protein RVBP17_1840 [Pseudomonas phage sp. 30-3]|uniref:Uncharacterized protein n=1 Tax=Pseudomonas phage vB_PaeM_PA5oct TaxID=2163605 RepID=A0A4Y5JUW5_9CAUD|nr:hypothetical protein PQE65_gp210 [Pseudomonas phage vB_PaeM_PA5oct]WMI31818.1 hypothetical protein GBBBJNDB_00115 [Pseudomonas phage Callisto]WPK38748.1 hypothetical protein Cassandra_0072 [Pseudomonas phage Cassandra]WPK39269.1 hypothetical protein Deiofobo_0072 [Pseudomonas phage Deifobo]WPK39781.1 hypothetical protein ETTORE_0072 [Pseudomonas phage Ettore]WPK40302.1 hypothetical protein Paride_0072 [Pseudomonas phage Paride]VOH54207.1 hypothetical protein MIJ3_00115 [Pseudomonas phage v